jgi:hypothetical protein
MLIFNRRNAVVGWLAWVIAKRVLKRTAKKALPGTVGGSRRPNLAAFVAGLAAAGAAVFLWRRLAAGASKHPDTPATGE